MIAWNFLEIENTRADDYIKKKKKNIKFDDLVISISTFYSKSNWLPNLVPAWWTNRDSINQNYAKILAQSFFDVFKNFKLRTDIFIVHYLNK